MLKAYLSFLLLVGGMLALIPQPIVGGILLGLGYWLFQNTSNSERSEAEGAFFGFCLLCGVVAGAATILSSLF